MGQSYLSYVHHEARSTRFCGAGLQSFTHESTVKENIMSGKTITVAIGAGAVIVAGVVFFAGTTPPPIIIGDGSTNVSFESITKRTSTEIEAYKLFRKVRSIKVVNGSDIVEATVPVDDAEWYLTGANGTVRADHKSHFPGKGVFAVCPSGWHGTGTLYVCNGDPFT